MYTPLPNPDKPWESISMDYMSDLPSIKRGSNFIFVGVDRFSKMAILTTCKKNIMAEAMANLFFEHVWIDFGPPKTIIYDQDSMFLSTFLSSLWSLLDTKLTKSTSFHPQTNGQTEVVNRMAVHILQMYNSKHPHTWDDNLPYVQHNYNKAIHNSIGHNPFRVGLGFQPLGPIDVALPLASTQAKSCHSHMEADKAIRFIERLSTSEKKSMIFCRKLMPSTSNTMISIRFHTNSKWVTRFGCICRKSASWDLIERFIQFDMGLTPSPRLWMTMLLN